MSNDNKCFNFAVISDIHLFDKTHNDSDPDAYKKYQSCRMFWDTNERFLAAAQKVNACNPDFVIITGDILDHISQANTNLYPKVLSSLIAKVYPVAGNHDHSTLHVGKNKNGEFDPSWDLIDPEKDKTAWAGIFPQNKLFYSFMHGGFKFIIIDNGRYQLTERQLCWLEAELKASQDESALIFNHIPMKTAETTNTLHKIWGDNESLVIHDNDPQFDLLSNYQSKIKCIFSGHLHSFSDDSVNGLHQIVCPMTVDSPDKFLMVSCNSETGELNITKSF